LITIRRAGRIGATAVKTVLWLSALILAISTGGCGASFCPDQPNGWCAKHYNDRIAAINGKMAKMVGRTEDEVSAVLGQPATVAKGENDEKAMVYLFLRSPGAARYFSWPSIEEGGSAIHAESSRISRTFILNREGVVDRWAWRGFVGCEDCWGDSIKGASWRTAERVPDALKRRRSPDLTDP
jgi:hypothetical protein